MDPINAAPVALPDVMGALVPSALRPPSEGGGGRHVDVKEAAQEFEGYFLSYLMRVMRETVPDGPFDSKAAKAFYSFYDAEIGRRAARAGGIGLAKSLEGALETRSSEPPADGALKSTELPTDTTSGNVKSFLDGRVAPGGPAVTGGRFDGNF